MTFNQLHRGSCYLIFFPFWLNYIWTSVTYNTKLHEDCLSNVYTLSSSAHIWWNSKDDRFITDSKFLERQRWIKIISWGQSCSPAAFNSNRISLLYREGWRTCFTSRLFKELLSKVGFFIAKHLPLPFCRRLSP